MSKQIVLTLALCPCLLLAQQEQNGPRHVTGVVDFTNSPHTLPIGVGTVLPSGCTTGELFFKSDATAGQNTFQCMAGTWTQFVNFAGAGGSVDLGAHGLKATFVDLSGGGAYRQDIVMGACPGTASAGADYSLCMESGVLYQVSSVGVKSLLIPAFQASGTNHAPGAVPDPGAVAGTTRFPREDGIWAIPGGAIPVSGTMISLTGPIGQGICTAPCQVTVPTPTSGGLFCVQDDEGLTSAITILNPGSGAMFGATDHSGYGTANTGVLASTDGTFSSICLLAQDTTHYVVRNSVGTWTQVNTPASAPTFSPVAGFYSGTQSVTISTTTSGCASSIYWNTAGSPTTGSNHGTTASVTTSETVYAKVIGCGGYSDSSIASANYSITAVYSGPGDVVPLTIYNGLRAYSLAVASAHGSIANICNASDANCADIQALITGDFDAATAQGAPLNCGGAGGTCTVKTLYDQTGGGNNLAQATIALRPTLTFGCLSSKVCMSMTSSQTMGAASAISGFIVAPFGTTWVAKRTSGTAQSNITSISPMTSSTSGFNGSGETFIYQGSVLVGAGTENAFHAVQGLYGTTTGNSSITTDGTTVTGNSGVFGSQGTWGLGGLDPSVTVQVVEVGFLRGNLGAGTIISDLTANQRAYWGF